MTVLIAILVALLTYTTDASDDEEKLLKDLLFKDHRKDMRPVLNDNDTVTVIIGLSLNQIIDVDEKNQIMTTSVWTRLKWYNQYLTWNKSDYGNISSINVKSSAVWLPDVVLYNNADESVDFRGNLDRLATRIQINHDGYNQWMAPAMVKSKCKINVEYFPFDSQNCSLKFGSWTYDLKGIDMVKESDTVDLMKYIDSGEWRLTRTPVRRSEVKYYCCPEVYPDVTFYFIFKRRTLFYLTNLILPLVMISVLIIFVFTLPPQSGERISMSITLLLAMMVFMLMITEQIPATSEVVPLVAKFYMAVTLEMAIALIITCYVLRCYHSSSDKVPRWMTRLVIKKLGNFFGVSKSVELRKQEEESGLGAVQEEKGLNGFISRMITSDPWKKNDGDGETQSLGTTADAGYNDKHHVLEEKTKSIRFRQSSADVIGEEILHKLDVISGNIEAHEQDSLVQEQWLVIATVMDRLAMWIFAAVIVGTIVAIFYQAPGYVS